MRFGICTAVDKAAVVKQAGWDFVEESVQRLFAPRVADEQWGGAAAVAAAALPVPAANGLVPGELKITGPQVRRDELLAHMNTVIRRAAQTGTRIIVFGSGAARSVPEGFDRATARQQIIDFLRDSAAICQQHQVILVVEPLNRRECNIINSVAQAMEYVHAVDHPNVMCLLDSYHFWLEDEPLANVEKAMGWIRHVHVADREGRVPPGESGQADYRPLFGVLKSGGYDGLISVEARFADLPAAAPRVLDFLMRQWEQA
ncbi:sugar phosphate isomerase/epimerase family protein [Fontivita pretiosa]|uniref:sugar phosphate isomerase/epimerase family protein n=1 Tax=Fontivita pretiosa TaxID=2989684 RepID=UPI003D170E95